MVARLHLIQRDFFNGRFFAGELALESEDPLDYSRDDIQSKIEPTGPTANVCGQGVQEGDKLPRIVILACGCASTLFQGIVNPGSFVGLSDCAEVDEGDSCPRLRTHSHRPAAARNTCTWP